MASFSISTKIFFGRSGLEDLFAHLKKMGLLKVSFIADKNIEKIAAFSNLIDQFRRSDFQITGNTLLDTSREPSYDLLDQFTENLRGKEIDVIIAVGGGSVLDMAKGVGILLKNPGKGIDYRGMDKVTQPGIPVVCIPTTAGTGSEVTHTASFIDTQGKTKLGINGKHVTPLCGLLMPELTFSCPASVTIASGLDAMLHAMEAVTAKTATLVTQMLGSRAFGLLYSHFDRVLNTPFDYGAREGMLLGSYYAGIAMMNAGGGPASGISYPLGVHFSVPHGIAGGIFLPHVIELNVSKGYHGYTQIYNELPDANKSLPPDQKSRDFAFKFHELYKRIGAPTNLSTYGVGKKNIDLLTTLTMDQRLANLELNPVPCGKEDVISLLTKVTD